MFRETLFFKTALYSANDWLAKIRQPIFLPGLLCLAAAFGELFFKPEPGQKL